MRCWTCIDHDQHWVQPASVIVAPDEDAARALLDATLISVGLKPHAQSAYTLQEIDLSVARAHILSDGDY